MRHRRFIIAQAALAVAFAITAMCSDAFVPSAILPLPSNNCLLFAAYEGRARIFFVHSSQPMVVSRAAWHPGFLFESADNQLALPPALAGPRGNAPFQTAIRLGSRRELDVNRAPNSNPILSMLGGSFGGAWRSQMFRPAPPLMRYVPQLESTFIRFPLWPLAIILMYVPIRRAILERRMERRRIRNQCLACGYSLNGLASPRCPECGVTI